MANSEEAFFSASHYFLEGRNFNFVSQQPTKFKTGIFSLWRNFKLVSRQLVRWLSIRIWISVSGLYWALSKSLNLPRNPPGQCHCVQGHWGHPDMIRHTDYTNSITITITITPCCLLPVLASSPFKIKPSSNQSYRGCINCSNYNLEFEISQKLLMMMALMAFPENLTGRAVKPHCWFA